jgi:hypothetical protein
MNRKIAAVLLAATMLTTPAFAASVANSPNTTPTTQTVTPDKVTKTSDKGVKKHRVHARASYGHKVHHVEHAIWNQVDRLTKATVPKWLKYIIAADRC